jgi:hypothetical protein
MTRYLAILIESFDPLAVNSHVFHFEKPTSIDSAWEQIDLHMDADYVLCIQALPDWDIYIKWGDSGEHLWYTANIDYTALPGETPKLAEGIAEGGP